MKNSGEIYPNSELIEVSFGITFDGSPAIECKRDLFYEEIRKDYPKIYVPELRQGDHLGLIPYHFENIEQNAGIKTALNQFSYFTREYEGHKIFITNSVKYCKQFTNIYDIKKLNSFNWQYVNIIPFVRQRGIIPFDDFLKFDISIPVVFDKNKELKGIDFEIENRIPEGLISIKVQNISAKCSIDKEAILLITRFEKVETLDSKNIKQYLSEGHRICRSFFEESITESYRQYLRGETV
jgi:uncharacterized protein (TIGR04255 family)